MRLKSTWSKWAKEAASSDAELKNAGPFTNFKKFARKELRALVDYYGIRIDERPEEAPPDGGPWIWNVGDMHQPWPLRDESDAVHINRLETLLQDDDASHYDVFETYKHLPAPGVVYLKIDTIRSLLHHLAVVERPSVIAMQRYLSILDDMKTSHIHIKRPEWTSAINLAGRAMGRVTADDLQTALYIWRDMELRAGIKGGYVTLNVLFSLAVKAGKYELAETMMKELRDRNLQLHRHFRVSIIYYYGVMRNGDAVRKTYQDLVNAGDIVDTVVLNSVIAALFRAGEPAAAEQVFERMKRMHAAKRVSAPGHRFLNGTWRGRRLVGLHLTYSGRRFRQNLNEEALKELQGYAPIAPNTRTYGLLIRHQAITVGNADRVHELLREMRHGSIPLDGTIFIVIFQGFANFGGVRYTSWTAYQLEKIWKQYLQALDEGLEGVWVSVMSTIAALKAFAKCSSPDRTLQAWEEIRKHWHPNEEELESVMIVLRKLLDGKTKSLPLKPVDDFFDSEAPGH